MLGRISLIGSVGLLAVNAGLLAQEAPVEGPTLAPPRCEYGSPHPDAPEELSQFDFLIGDFTITAHAWRGDRWSPPRPGVPARWNGYYGLGGRTIVDDWYDRDPGMQPDTTGGTNIRLWDAEDGEWDMMWIHTNSKQVQDLRAKLIDGKLTMWRIYPSDREMNAYFERTGPNSWHRISLTKNEAGEWVPQFKLAATRIPCPED